jgi:hypothetical protein
MFEETNDLQPRLTLHAFLAALVFSLAVAGLHDAIGDEPDCITDSECMLLCPPPADDPDCDGGPR